MSRRGTTCEDERGSLSIMIIGFAVILVLMLTLIVNVSKAFLWRREVAGWADSAALYASQSIGEAGTYEITTSDRLAVDQRAAERAVDSFVRTNDLSASLPGLRAAVRVDAVAGTVTVRLSTRMPYTFGDALGADTLVEGSATATSPLF